MATKNQNKPPFPNRNLTTTTGASSVSSHILFYALIFLQIPKPGFQASSICDQWAAFVFFFLVRFCIINFILFFGDFFFFFCEVLEEVFW
jgi:hypothetical protein